MNCSMCNFVSVDRGRTIKHIVREHRFDPNFSTQCKCGISYRNWISFKSHVYRKHRNEIILDDIAEDEVPIPELPELHVPEVADGDGTGESTYIEPNTTNLQC